MSGLKCLFGLSLGSLAAFVQGAFVVTAFPPGQWSASNATLGLNNPWFETFESSPMLPGLQAKWIAGAGTVGPTNTLPAIFRNAFDDPFGNAFANGPWEGFATLVNGQGNTTWPYGAGSTRWGQLELTFPAGTTGVGFSVQNMNLDATLLVNGGVVGTFQSLGAPNFSLGNSRNGYFIVRSNDATPITTLLIQNASGDGYTIDHLAILGAAPKFNASATPAANWGLPSNEALGLAKGVTEEFEDPNLEPGLSVQWFTAAGNSGPFTALPNVFRPVTDDPNGNAFDLSPWGGSGVLLNTRDNRSYPYSAVANYGDIQFTIAGDGARAVGFSVGDLDYPMDIVINDKKFGTTGFLYGISQLGTGSRAGYLTITATTENILRVRLKNGRASFNDGWGIDHFTWVPAGRLLGGRIILDGFASDYGTLPVTIQAYNAGTSNLVRTYSVTPYLQGDYSIAAGNISNGAYDFVISTPTSLRRKVSGVTVDISGAIINGTLDNGDADEDEEVTIFDYIVLSNAFGKEDGDAGWEPQADFDGDKVISIFDYVILSTNFGEIGD